MKEITDKKISIEYDELDDLEFPKDTLFELSINLKSTKYEFIINAKTGSDKLIVLGSGAIGSTKHDRSKPFYNRWSWKYEESFICYNDPSIYLSDELEGGWGIGVEDDYYLENLKDIFLKISKKLDVKHENILFYGSSMGAFMSIQLATMIRGSMAFADIPQFDLYTYSEKHWMLLKKYCFGGKPDEYIIENYGYRINVIEMMKRENYIPKAVLNLDFSVDYDVEHQYMGFFRGLNELDFKGIDKNYIRIAIDYKIGKHSALGKKETLEAIHGILNKDYMIYLDQLEDSRLYNENKMLEEENKSLKDELNSIISSNSWKLTSNFRKVGSKFRKK